MAVPPRTVTELVIAAQSGDSSAVSDLYERYRDHLFFEAFKSCHCHSLADDIVQESFLMAMQKINQLKSPKAFRFWMKQIVRTVSCRSFNRSRPVLGVDLTQTPDRRPTASEEAEIADERAKVLSLLRKLNPRHRKVAEAFYLNERTIAQISKDLGMPDGTVKRKLHEARAIIRQKLG